MRLHRFIVDAALVPGTIAIRDPGLRNQLANVLRLAAGDAVTLCDGKGIDARAVILGFTSNATEFAVDAISPNEAESRVRTTLYCAVLKRENFELAAQKAVEAGVARIVPVITRRTVKTGLRTDRLAKIAKEAAEQSGRGILPAIAAPMPFKEALDDASANAVNVMFELDAAPFRAADARGGVGVWIGPEGGWDDDEVAAARARGFLVAGLGPRTLRAETAVIVATYLVSRTGDAGEKV